MYVFPREASGRDSLAHVLPLFGCLALVACDRDAARAESQERSVRLLDVRNVLAIQREPENKATGRYDWGPSVMRDGALYKMWWVRLGGSNKKRFPYAATLPDGERFEFTYPDRGDRIYYAESRDGKTWQLGGEDFTGSPDEFKPDADGPLMVLGPAESAHEINHLGCPSVIKVNGTYYMYYEAPAEYNVVRGPDRKPVVRGEYHNQVFVATSQDGKRWQRHPDNRDPQPIVRAPDANKQPGRQRYGLGQPSVFHRGGTFVMHYVDSCTGPGDFIVRIEADNPYFDGARKYPRSLRGLTRSKDVPLGAVARFAQTDVKYLGNTCYLLRPAYDTGNLGILASRIGPFRLDATASAPRQVFPQIRVQDPRGDNYRERLFPRFLTDSEGQILVEKGRVILYYSSGLGFKEQAHTWDIHRSELPLEDFKDIRP